MSEEKKQRLKENQKNYYKTKKAKEAHYVLFCLKWVVYRKL